MLKLVIEIKNLGDQTHLSMNANSDDDKSPMEPEELNLGIVVVNAMKRGLAEWVKIEQEKLDKTKLN